VKSTVGINAEALKILSSKDARYDMAVQWCG